LLVTTGLILFGLVMVILVAGYQFMYRGQIYPGVAPVWGVDIAGMDRQEAIAALSQAFAYDEQATFAFTYQPAQEWRFTADELGVTFDAEATVERAYQAGRGGNWLEDLFDPLRIRRGGEVIAPVVTYNRTDAERVLAQIAAEGIDRHTLNASVKIVDGRATAYPSQTGRSLDMSAALSALRGQVLTLQTRSQIPLSTHQSAPQFSNYAQAQAVAERANVALSAPVEFCIPGGSGVGPDVLARLESAPPDGYNVEPVRYNDGTFCYRLYLDESVVRVVEDTAASTIELATRPDRVREFLSALVQPLTIEPQNARFIFDDDSRQLELIQNSVSGRELDVAATLAQFEDALFASDLDDRQVNLAFRSIPPAVGDNATGLELGITELVRAQTTYYYGSTAARVHNIGVAASRFHGIVIPPGERFSFNEWLGDVSAATGYREGLVIMGDWTVRDVGGGVCQVATTAFQTAFYGGYPIQNRVPHAYRVSYYEDGEGAGLDATVYYPDVDFVFLNDTPYHLLIETYNKPGSSTLTWKFYSTKTRRVVKEGPYINNVTQPGRVEYRAHPDFSSGQIQHVSYASSGADVVVRRIVYEGDTIIRDEKFESHYDPWPDQYYVAPGDPRINK